MYHKNKSIKELVNSRISGQVYQRIAKPGVFSESSSSLQSIARSVLKQNERHEIASELFDRASLKAENLNTAILSNSIQSANPVPHKIKTPTILQKLNPSKNKREQAYIDVAKVQAEIAKEASIDPNLMVEMQKVQVAQKATVAASPKAGFTKFPSKFVSNFR